ncbi:MAG TPA: Na(+)/H(+) antiporter subunit D [Kiloniellales bacterium]
MIDFSPGLILILGALPIPFLRQRERNAYMLALPLVGLGLVFTLEPGLYGRLPFLGFELTTLRVDALANVFGIIFFAAAAISVLYALKINDTLQQVAAFLYAGGAIGAVYAGDLITLFVFWEMTAIASVFLIWARKTERAYRAGMRYLIIQVGSGVLLLAGALFHIVETGSVAFDALGLGSWGTNLIFLAFGIKCAFPFLHNWLQDAYPEATVSGTVWLSVYTTKLAVYALARGYPGTEILIWIGCAMTAFPIFFAVIENDMRRVLSYSLNNQLGFMVAGIGIGTELAINGAVAHAFAHILYKALLFMSMGAVLHRVGHVKASSLGGLYKSMPWTAGLCMIGSASISAFPLFSGFVSKSLILAAAAQEGHTLAFLILLFASAGVLDHSGIKIPFFTFFFRDSGIRVREAPRTMLAAMGITAFLCIAIGVWPGPLYAILPYPVAFEPYTASHVINQSQLLLFAMLAFVFLMRTGLYPPELPSVNLDFDVVYRKGLPRLVAAFIRTFEPVDRGARRALLRLFRYVAGHIYRHHGPSGALARSIGAGSMVFWVVAMLAGYLVLSLTSF